MNKRILIFFAIVTCCGLCGTEITAEDRMPSDTCHKTCDYIVGMGRIFCDAPGRSGHNGCMAFFYENWFDCVVRCEIDFRNDNIAQQLDKP